MSLLDNRKSLSSRQSMEILISYARKQDHAINILKLRKGRAVILTNILLFFPLSAYCFYEFSIGYWQSIYPRSLIQNSFAASTHNKRMYFTPEYYFKEREQWSKDLKDVEA